VKVYHRLLLLFEGSGLTSEEHLEEHLRRWHPDRLEAKFLNKVVERDRDKVRVCAREVYKILGQILVNGLD
jgi:hypothetical protein